MADYYFKTLGQAWSAIVSAFTAFDQLTYVTSGFAITWTPSTAFSGGYFVVAGTTFAGPAYANGNYYAQEAVAGANIPINNVVREPGFSDVAQVTTITGSGTITADNLAYQLALARATAIQDITAAGFVDSFQWGTPYDGGTVDLGIYYGWLYTTNNDVAFDIISVIDKAGMPTGAPITWPPIPTYVSVPIATIVNNIDVGPQLDTNMAINNGSIIDTVIAKQFTGA